MNGQTAHDSIRAPSPVRRYGANLFGQAAGRAVYLLAGFASFVMVAKYAGPDALGHYSIAMAIVALSVIAADFGTTLTFGARLGARVDGERSDEVAAMLSARLILGGGVGLALLAALPVLPAHARPAIALAACGMPLLAARFFDPLYQVCGRPGWSAGPSFANAAILLVGTALCLVLQAPDWSLAMVAVAAGIAYGATGLALSARLAPLRLAPWREGAALLREAFAVGISNALGAVNARVGIMMLATLAGAVEVGLFTAGYRFFELGAAVAITVATPLVPLFAKALAEGGDAALLSQTRAALRLALSITLPGAIAAYALAGPVTGLLFGPAYEATVPVLRLTAFMSVAMLSATILFVAMVALRRTRFAVAYSALGVSANAALCALLIPWDPVAGAAWAALGAELAMLAVAAAMVWRALGAPLGLADLPRVLAPSLILAAAILASPDAYAPLALALAAALAAASVVLMRPRPLAAAAPQAST